MHEDIQIIVEDCEDHMKKSLTHLEGELMKIRAGRANPIMLDGITVASYGAEMPINQLATVATTDARTLTVQPWDKSNLAGIERAIINSNRGLNPSNDGDLIRISIPSLTEERRKTLVKAVRDEGEKARIALRQIRHKGHDEIKTLVKDGDGVSEDAGKRGDGVIDELTKSYGNKVEEIQKAKEGEIMTV